ncbi:hypothetical protein [Achromobacter insuavis]|uniref:hypothetical protein n=1 Tax=Achromobacter insuavis TaxID=1287735 RepID=UPI0015D3FFBD|nr:hypothetical protein [Achromobacter insuavis]
MPGLLGRQVLRHNSFMASRFTPTDFPVGSKPATSNKQAATSKQQQASSNKQQTSSKQTRPADSGPYL